MVIFRNKNILLWFIASSITVLGDFFFSTIIPVVIFNLTKSSQFAVLVAFCDILPVIILSPYIGYIVDVYNKKKIIIVSNVVAGVLLLMLCVIPPNPWIYLLVNSLVSILALIYLTTAKTVLPLIIDDSSVISRVNSALSLVLEITALTGAALAGIAITYFPYKFLYFIDAVSFFCNVVLILIISFMPISSDNNKAVFIKETFRESYKTAITYMKTNKNFLVSTCYYSMFFFLRGLLFSQIVVFLISDLELSDSSYALFQNLILMGVLVAHLLMSKYELQSNQAKWIGISLVMACIFLISFSLVANLYIMIGFGISQAFIINRWYLNFYRSTPENIRGKLISLSGMCFELSRLLGNVCVGFTITYIPVKNSLVFFSYLTIILVLIIGIFNTNIRKNSLRN